MSQTDRKYDGPTIQELRAEDAPAPPPPRFKKRSKPHGRKRIRKANVWSWGEDKNARWDWTARWKPRYSIYAGWLSGGYRSLISRHVVRRLKAIAMQDVRCDIIWLESQATGEQISPEFSSREGLLNWLEYEGLKRGYLKVASFISYCWNPKTRTGHNERGIRLEET